jgi:hypothetical protein
LAKVITYDVSGVEESGGGTGVKVRPGVKVAKIETCEQRTENAQGGPANDIKVGLNFGPDFDWGFTYVGLGPASDWKLAEFIRACGLPPKGKFDPEKQRGKFIRVKVNPGTYEGAYSPDMGRLMKAQPGDEKKWPGINGKAELAEDEPDDAEPDNEADDTTEDAVEKTYEDPDFVPSRENDPEIGSYDDWEDADLESEVNDRGLTLAGGRGKKRDKFIAALRAEDEEVNGATPDDEPEPEEEPETDAASDDEDEYDTWDLEKLKEEWEARSLGDIPNFRGKGASDRIKAALVEGLKSDDEENPFEG